MDYIHQALNHVETVRMRSVIYVYDGISHMLEGPLSYDPDSLMRSRQGNDKPWARILGPCHAKKNVFEHAQNVRILIILHMRKVSSGHLLSIETLYSIQ